MSMIRRITKIKHVLLSLVLVFVRGIRTDNWSTKPVAIGQPLPDISETSTLGKSSFLNNQIVVPTSVNEDVISEILKLDNAGSGSAWIRTYHKPPGSDSATIYDSSIDSTSTWDSLKKPQEAIKVISSQVPEKETKFGDKSTKLDTTIKDPPETADSTLQKRNDSINPSYVVWDDRTENEIRNWTNDDNSDRIRWILYGDNQEITEIDPQQISIDGSPLAGQWAADAPQDVVVNNWKVIGDGGPDGWRVVDDDGLVEWEIIYEGGEWKVINKDASRNELKNLISISNNSRSGNSPYDYYDEDTPVQLVRITSDVTTHSQVGYNAAPTKTTSYNSINNEKVGIRETPKPKELSYNNYGQFINTRRQDKPKSNTDGKNVLPEEKYIKYDTYGERKEKEPTRLEEDIPITNKVYRSTGNQNINNRNQVSRIRDWSYNIRNLPQQSTPPVKENIQYGARTKNVRDTWTGVETLQNPKQNVNVVWESSQASGQWNPINATGAFSFPYGISKEDIIWSSSDDVDTTYDQPNKKVISVKDRISVPESHRPNKEIIAIGSNPKPSPHSRYGTWEVKRQDNTDYDNESWNTFSTASKWKFPEQVPSSGENIGSEEEKISSRPARTDDGWRSSQDLAKSSSWHPRAGPNWNANKQLDNPSRRVLTDTKPSISEWKTGSNQEQYYWKNDFDNVGPSSPVVWRADKDGSDDENKQWKQNKKMKINQGDGSSSGEDPKSKESSSVYWNSDEDGNWKSAKNNGPSGLVWVQRPDKNKAWKTEAVPSKSWVPPQFAIWKGGNGKPKPITTDGTTTSTSTTTTTSTSPPTTESSTMSTKMQMYQWPKTTRGPWAYKWPVKTYYQKSWMPLNQEPFIEKPDCPEVATPQPLTTEKITTTTSSTTQTPDMTSSQQTSDSPEQYRPREIIVIKKIPYDPYWNPYGWQKNPKSWNGKGKPKQGNYKGSPFINKQKPKNSKKSKKSNKNRRISNERISIPVGGPTYSDSPYKRVTKEPTLLDTLKAMKQRQTNTLRNSWKRLFGSV